MDSLGNGLSRKRAADDTDETSVKRQAIQVRGLKLASYQSLASYTTVKPDSPIVAG